MPELGLDALKKICYWPTCGIKLIVAKNSYTLTPKERRVTSSGLQSVKLCQPGKETVIIGAYKRGVSKHRSRERKVPLQYLKINKMKVFFQKFLIVNPKT